MPKARPPTSTSPAQAFCVRLPLHLHLVLATQGIGRELSHGRGPSASDSGSLPTNQISTIALQPLALPLLRLALLAADANNDIVHARPQTGHGDFLPPWRDAALFKPSPQPRLHQLRDLRHVLQSRAGAEQAPR
jgi:hypothetical protein